MGKIKIGSMKHLTLVEGDVNLLKQGEILVTSDTDYTILRKKKPSGEIISYAVVPIEELAEMVKKSKSRTSKKKTNEANN